MILKPRFVMNCVPCSQKTYQPKVQSVTYYDDDINLSPFNLPILFFYPIMS